MFVGVVVFYNPKLNEVKVNIETYIHNLEQLIIIDNSEVLNTEVFEYFNHINKVHYKFSGENKGIAYALNRGIDFAKKYDAGWLLTMDQDSSFPTGEFSEFIYFMETEARKYEDAVIFSPVHTVPYLRNEEGVKKVNSVMTSGNFLNMNLVDTIGYFDERLFIDSVDHEYCFRINQKGFSVYRINDIQLEHNLGQLITKKFLNKTLFITNHNYIRRYYITRNLLYVIKKYSRTKLGFIRFLYNHLFWTFISIAFYEKDKKLKFKSMFLGYMDFKRSKLGKKSF